MRLTPEITGNVPAAVLIGLCCAMVVGVAACASQEELPAVETGADAPAEVQEEAAEPVVAEQPFVEVVGEALTTEALGNIEYDYVDGRATLVDGVYEEKPAPDSATFVVRLSLHELSALGDLDGDGVDDAAVILVNSPGGSGVFEYLAAVVNEAGTPVNVSTVLLGDRVKIDGLTIAEGRITLEVVTHGPDDAMCCPSHAEAWVYALEGDALVKRE